MNRLLIGNKSDITDKRVVSYEEGENLASQFKLNFIEASAKTAENIDSVFHQIAKNILERVQFT